MVGGLPDLALAGQEHQNIAAHTAAPELVHAIGNRVIEVVFAAFFKRAVALLDGKHAARDHDDGRRCEGFGIRVALQRGKVVGKTLGVDGGRGHDDLQVRPPG